MYCGEAGHLKTSCSIRPPNPNPRSVSSYSPFILSNSSFKMPITLTIRDTKIVTTALLDSGAADEIHLQMGALHHEKIRFYIIPSPNNPVILSLPWLRNHNPHISWREGQILHWDNTCHEHCLTPITPLPLRSVILTEQKPRHSRLTRGILRPLKHSAKSKHLSYHLTALATAQSDYFQKKDGGLQPCIDYRGLNDITVKFRYPLPLVPAALEQPRQAKYFTKLDLRSAYSLIRIKEGDQWKTAFSTSTSHYEYLVMPFGLSNSPSVFQSFINNVFRDMLDQWTSISFLGYIIGQEGVAIDESKVRAILEWPQPRTVKELQQFLGFANFYRRFIRNFSTVAAPLTAMTKCSTSRLSWTSEAIQAFQNLKERFTSILHHPDPSIPFIVEVDASSTGIGAILSQRQGEPAKMFPCAFYSRKLSSAERNYDVGNRKLLAMKAALEEWRHWLEGAQHPFTVLTDHKKLEYLRSAKRLNPRQARWAMLFTRFDFTVTYRPGSKNTKADALSRQSDKVNYHDIEENIIPEVLLIAPIQWDIMTEIDQIYRQNPPPPYCPPELTCVPEPLQEKLLHQVHTPPSSGHPEDIGSPWSGEPSDLPSFTEWLHRSEETWNQAHVHLQRAVRRQEEQANRHRRPHPQNVPGQWILRQITPVSFRLDLPANYRISPTFHVSLLKPTGNPRGESEEGAENHNPPPILVDGKEATKFENSSIPGAGKEELGCKKRKQECTNNKELSSTQTAKEV
ncbi:Transposon Tf2-9 polyprotein [Labeo rohita]|uniref:ribonuclease H n=1 Tax=Labeo rohita TaxID=84645 RepID=A0ABQ8MSV7_LABRO|nr:Transposon Tf2-9 polyprotein [Labeo rohita]